MDERLKYIVDHYEQMKIGVDEPFKFHCTQCGKCCINREDILLTPRDLYNIAKELELYPADVVERYCEVYVGQDSRIPIVRILPRGTVKRCPLLKDRKCSVHRAKPAVCAMFPIGRSIMLDAGKQSLTEITADQVGYIFTDPQCGDDAETHTVREWLGAFGIPLEDAFFLCWNRVVGEVGNFIRKVEKQFSPKTMEMLWTSVYVGLYLSYDMKKEFLPQFEDNASKLVSIIKNLEACKEGEQNG